MITVEKLVGFVTYENVLFPYEFEEESFTLYLYPPSQEICEQFNDVRHLSDMFDRSKKHYWVSKINLYGTTSGGYKIIFNVEGNGGIYQGFPSFNVNWYYYHEEGFGDNEIDGISIECDEINYFYPPSNTFESELQMDKEHKRINGATITVNQSSNISCGSFEVTDGIEASVELVEYANVRFNTIKNPLMPKSRMTITFSSPVELDVVGNVHHCIRRMFMYLTYRKNVSLDGICVFKKSDDGYRKYEGYLKRRKQNESEKHSKVDKHIIQYELIGKIVPDLLVKIMKNEIGLDHICNSIDDAHRYTISRIIMILAAFEGEFERIYGKNYNRSDSYKLVKQEAVELLERQCDTKAGKEKKYLKSIIRHIDNMDSSYSDRVICALDDCKTIMNPIVCQSYEGEFNEIIQDIGNRMNAMRNNIAHCNLNLQFDAIHICDFKIIEKLTYVIRLRKFGIDDENTRKAIMHLFG